MNLKDIKNIMNQVNEPNEFELVFHNINHPFYWIYKIDNVRVKSLYYELEKLRHPTARFDVFIEGLFISDVDYLADTEANTFYIKFIKANFPAFEDDGITPYVLDETDEVKIKGDIEKFK
jgi:hypothetical protein